MRGSWLVFVSACAPFEPAPAPAPAPAAVAAPAPPSAARAGELAFWLVSHDTWRSTLYWLEAGQLAEGETVATRTAPDIEPAGTLRWLTGCGARGGCSIAIRCPLRGPIEGAVPAAATACGPVEMVVTSRCSDGLDRALQLSLDGRCAHEEGPRATLSVIGEPISDGELAGWAPAVGLRYLPCDTLMACRSDFAAIAPGAFYAVAR